MKYVSLSTDANPAYSLWAPAAVRAWRLLGYQSIVFIHDEHWESPYGFAILAELARAGAHCVTVTSSPPLSTANTMRTVRLTAACLSFVHDDDVIVTSDVDLIPLDREWFSDPPQCGHLRNLFAWRNDNGTKPWTLADVATQRFCMSYASATAKRWRLMFPEYVENDPAASLHAFGFTYDSPDHDEALLASRLRVQPDLDLRDPAHATIVGRDLEHLTSRDGTLSPTAHAIRTGWPELAPWLDPFVRRVAPLLLSSAHWPSPLPTEPATGSHEFVSPMIRAEQQRQARLRGAKQS